MSPKPGTTGYESTAGYGHLSPSEIEAQMKALRAENARKDEALKSAREIIEELKSWVGAEDWISTHDEKMLLRARAWLAAHPMEEKP